MSKQTESLQSSLPGLSKLWQKVAAEPGKYEFVIARWHGKAADFRLNMEGVSFVAKGGQIEVFPSLTAALRASASKLSSGMSFERSQKAGQGKMCEAGQWGVWTVSGNVKDGKFLPSVGGKEFGIQFVLPVPKKSEPEAKPEPKAKAKPAPEKPGEAPQKPVRARKPKPEANSAASNGQPSSEPVLPEGIAAEGDKFRVGNLVLPSLAMAEKALAAQSRKAPAESVKPEGVEVSE